VSHRAATRRYHRNADPEPEDEAADPNTPTDRLARLARDPDCVLPLLRNPVWALLALEHPQLPGKVTEDIWLGAKGLPPSAFAPGSGLLPLVSRLPESAQKNVIPALSSRLAHLMRDTIDAIASWQRPVDYAAMTTLVAKAWAASPLDGAKQMAPAIAHANDAYVALVLLRPTVPVAELTPVLNAMYDALSTRQPEPRRLPRSLDPFGKRSEPRPVDPLVRQASEEMQSHLSHNAYYQVRNRRIQSLDFVMPVLRCLAGCEPSGSELDNPGLFLSMYAPVLPALRDRLRRAKE
jgi:hypothetical protein